MIRLIWLGKRRKEFFLVGDIGRVDFYRSGNVGSFGVGVKLGVVGEE